MTRTTTILEELTRPNPDVVCHANGGSNSYNGSWPAVEGWSPWKGFNASTLHKMFKDVVESEWVIKKDPDPPVTTWDGEFFDEDELEHDVINKHILPPVNAALQHALKYLKIDQTLSLGRAGRTSWDQTGDRRFRADWALCRAGDVSVFENGSFRYYNRLPGDTKVSVKWDSSFYETDLASWRDPVRQIVHYCILSRSRYAFIITDAELVAIRICTELTGDGLASTRSRRQHLGHAQQNSVSTDVSRLSADLQNTSLNSSSSYQPTGPAVDDYPVEYKSISWQHHGKSKLTIRLTLFYLALMAVIGGNSPQPSYPSLDSFWFAPDGACVHNTTGLVSKKEPKNLEYPTPWVDRGPMRVFDDDGPDVLTLESVFTLDITKSAGKSYFYFMDGEDMVLVNREVLVYDVAQEQYGYFEGLEWRIGSPPEESRPKKKPRK